jgi:hypothetical protein
VVIEPFEGGVESPVVLTYGIGRVDIERGAVFLGKGLEADLFAVEVVVLVVELMHRAEEGRIQ